MYQMQGTSLDISTWRKLLKLKQAACVSGPLQMSARVNEAAEA